MAKLIIFVKPTFSIRIHISVDCWLRVYANQALRSQVALSGRRGSFLWPSMIFQQDFLWSVLCLCWYSCLLKTWATLLMIAPWSLCLNLLGWFWVSLYFCHRFTFGWQVSRDTQIILDLVPYARSFMPVFSQLRMPYLSNLNMVPNCSRGHRPTM